MHIQSQPSIRLCLTIAPELLISGSTGISRPLGDPAKIAEYLAGDQQSELRRRLESVDYLTITLQSSDRWTIRRDEGHSSRAAD